MVKYKKIDIGCGSSKCDPDAIGIDIAAVEGVDIVGDALEVLCKFENNSVGAIYSSHFLEHHENPSAILKEMVRVTTPGGIIELRVPHFSDPWYYSDPTHKHLFGLYTFAYYFSNKQFSRKVPKYCLIDGASIEKITLRFGSTRPFYIRHAMKKMMQVVVNFSSYTQELYEEMFSNIFNCSEIHIMIKKAENDSLNR
jgi:predicted SAM-dependent methyltransferase